jgi:hypothetical protein
MVETDYRSRPTVTRDAGGILPLHPTHVNTGMPKGTTLIPYAAAAACARPVLLDAPILPQDLPVVAVSPSARRQRLTRSRTMPS